MKEIAKMWNIPTSQVDSLFPCNKPIIQVIVFFAKVCLLWLFVISSFFTDTPLLQNFASDLQVGRVVLERTKKMVCMDLECAYTEHTVLLRVLLIFVVFWHFMCRPVTKHEFLWIFVVPYMFLRG